MTSTTIRKQMLVAEIIILTEKLKRSDPSMRFPYLWVPLNVMDLKELETTKRELGHIYYSLSGAS